VSNGDEGANDEDSRVEEGEEDDRDPVVDSHHSHWTYTLHAYIPFVM
jgi:hypothetical protein